MKKLILLSQLLATAPLFCMVNVQPLHLKEINPHRTIHFDRNGHFNDGKQVALFIEQAVHENAAPRCLSEIHEVKKLSKEAQEAKFSSEQLWKITCKEGSSFILKEIHHDKAPLEEIKRLERGRTSQRLQQYVHPHERDNLQLIFPSSYLKYTFKGRDHVLVLMPQARGKSLQSLMEEFNHKSDDSGIIHKVSKAYYRLGAAMAEFYKKFGTLDKTVSHKDFHHGNIFYHHESGLISLIDNERIAPTLENGENISSDLGHLLVTSPFVLEWAHRGFLDQVDVKKWYQIVVPSFICGFIRTYKKEERVDIFKNLVQQICAWNSNVDKETSRTIRGIIKEVLISNDKNPQNMETQLVREGKSELHIAAGNPDLTALAEILLEEKTSALHETDIFGNTPLHEAAYFGCLETVKLLLAAGADSHALNARQESPLFKARFMKQDTIADLLQKSSRQHVQITVVKGDITMQPVDVIVNAANSKLAAGGGVCGAIFAAAGHELIQACHVYPLHNGVRCAVGDACITPSGALQRRGVKKIIHAVGPDGRIIKDRQQQKKLLGSAYQKSLELAAQRGFKSIAFPFISSGIYQVDSQLAAKTAVTAVQKYCADNKTSLQEVRFLVHGDESYELFKSLLKA